MESNNKNNNYEQGEEQLRKRKFNELANDGQPIAEEGEQKQQEPPENLSKKKCELQGNDELENLDLESLTREELINLVRKQLANIHKAHKQLEEVKKKAEESAKQQAKEMTTKMKDLQMALLASQQKVEQEQLTTANLNVEHQQKHLDSAKQAEEFAQRILQLEQEKAAVHEDMRQKMAEIVKMHTEVEEKSEKLGENAKQIDALLIQLNESTSHQHQIGVSNEQQEQMKIQLSLETWYDMLAFVPRHRLGQIVPKIGDRKFASIVQPFLHKYGEITIDHIEIVAPYEEDPNGHPRVQVWQNNRLPLRLEMAKAQMPANIKSFGYFDLSYLDQSVLNFMQEFQQNGLLDNVNLSFSSYLSKDIVQQVLCHLLPLINGILSIEVVNNAQLVHFYDAGNSKEIYDMYMKMMEETRLLVVRILYANKIDLYCRWLYQPARADGKPRVLLLERKSMDFAPIYHFIDRLRQDLLMATDPATFLIRINLPEHFQPQEEGICLDNDKTKERLLTKTEVISMPWNDDLKEVVLLISRCPLASTKKWIEENEKEILAWDLYRISCRTICLAEELKVVAI